MKRALALVTLLFVLAGCGGSTSSLSGDWTARVEVKDGLAMLWVEVPGKKMGRDYHPHLKLNNGPEVMMFTPSYAFKNLEPGSYELWMQLQTPDHRPIIGTEKTLTFEIP